MADHSETKNDPHLYGSADTASREPPPANGLRGEGAATPLDSDETKSAEDPNAPNKQGR